MQCQINMNLVFHISGDGSEIKSISHWFDLIKNIYSARMLQNGKGIGILPLVD